MNFRKTLNALCLLAAAGWAAGPRDLFAQSGYTFTSIVERGPVFLGVGNASLNNVGSVAFVGTFFDVSVGNQSGTFVGRGGENELGDYTRIDLNNTSYGSINDSGQVSFHRGLSPEGLPQRTLFRGDGTSSTALFSPSNSFTPPINNSGTAALVEIIDGEHVVLTAGGGAPNELYRTGRTRPDFDAILSVTDINDAGTVAFAATQHGFFPLDSGIRGIFTGSGGNPTVIHELVGPNIDIDIGAGLSLNNNGRVAFIQQTSVVGPTEHRVVVAGGGLSVIATNTTGVFREFRQVSLNDAGTVVFQASLPLAGTLAATINGLLTGDDPVADRVIAQGDSLFGSTVNSLAFGREGLNNQGQIAFTVGLADGRNMIVRADPTATSTTIRWTGPADLPPGTPPSGLFSVAENWDPQQTPDIENTVVFDLDSTYAVDIETASVKSLRVIDGHVTFRGDGGIVSAASSLAPAGSLAAASGGTSGGSSGGRLNAAENLTVGRQGRLSLDNALVVVSPTADVDGPVTVQGASTWALSQLNLGISGEAMLTVSDSSTVTSTNAVLGVQAGGLFASGGVGNAVVRGADTTWEIGGLTLGQAGRGSLEIRDGALVTVTGGVVADMSDSSGVITVTGVSEGVPARLTIENSQIFTIGKGGNGTLNVQAAGVVSSTGSLAIGSSDLASASPGDGKVTVSLAGLLEVKPSLSSLPGSQNTLIIGGAGKGELVLESGGRVTSPIVEIGSSIDNGSSVSVSGFSPALDRSTLAATELVVRSGELAIGNGGKVEGRTVTVGAGATAAKVVVGNAFAEWLVTESLKINASGTVRMENPDGAILIGTGDTELGKLKVGSGGSLSGTGTIVANVAHGGTFLFEGAFVEPGFSPGTLTIDGDYEQRAGGMLEIEIGGLAADSQFDVLAITGDATLGGTLILKFLDGFAPTAGDTFEFLNVGGIVAGNFAEVQIQNLAPGFQFDPAQIQQGALLALNDGIAVPEPASLAMLIAGVLATLFRRGGAGRVARGG